MAAHQQQQTEVEDGGEQQERARRVEGDGDRALPREGRQRAQAHQREQHLVRVGLEVQSGVRHLASLIELGLGAGLGLELGLGLRLGLGTRRSTGDRRHKVRVRVG